jgi:hypothetical protein
MWADWVDPTTAALLGGLLGGGLCFLAGIVVGAFITDDKNHEDDDPSFLDTNS